MIAAAARRSVAVRAAMARTTHLRVLSTQPSRLSSNKDIEMLNSSLEQTDPELFDIMEKEKLTISSHQRGLYNKMTRTPTIHANGYVSHPLHSYSCANSTERFADLDGL